MSLPALTTPAADVAVPDPAWLATAPTQLAALMSQHAPGSAGATAGWWGGFGHADGSAPELWRIGIGTVAHAPPNSAGFPIGIPLLDESHLQVASTPRTRQDAEDLVELLTLRAMQFFRPGLVRLHVWNIAQFTGSLPGLYPLTRTGLLTVHDPANLAGLIDELSTQIRRVHTRVLVDGHPTIKAATQLTGKRDEPWHIAVLLGNGQPLPDKERRDVERVTRSALSCGISVVAMDLPLTMGAPAEQIRFTDERVFTSMTGKHIAVTPDIPPTRPEAVAACQRIADEHERLLSLVGSFADLLPADDAWGTADSRAGLVAPIGFVEGRPAEVRLDDESPHALVGGPSGSGKTNFLLGWIGSLAARYSPADVEFYLLDFKEGVSFAQFAPRRDATWLPHARLVGVNVNDDREFGLELLRHLAREMQRRAAAAKDHEVAKLAELRDADPQGHWPRIVAVIDEFQYLLNARDPITKEATRLLEDLARRGRSQGIHLVLASQDVSSIEAFWGRAGIVEQFVLRIALPRARKVLRDEAPLGLPKHSVIVNHASGVAHAHEFMRMPNASERASLDLVQHRVHAMYPIEPPRLFDGSKAPRLADLIIESESPRAVLGQRMNVAGSPAVLDLTAGTGRNLAVLGADARAANRVLDAAAESLVGHGKHLVLDLTSGTTPDALASAVSMLAGEVRARRRGAACTPVFVVVKAADSAVVMLDKTGLDNWKGLLRFGPELGIHVLGWWRSLRRFKELLGSGGLSLDDVGALVGVDIPGEEFKVLTNPTMSLTWQPRPDRALWFDRALHAQPETIILPAVEMTP